MFKNILDLSEIKNKIKFKVLFILKKVFIERYLKDITRKPNLFEIWYVQTIKIKINRNIIKKRKMYNCL